MDTATRKRNRLQRRIYEKRKAAYLNLLNMLADAGYRTKLEKLDTKNSRHIRQELIKTIKSVVNQTI